MTSYRKGCNTYEELLEYEKESHKARHRDGDKCRLCGVSRWPHTGGASIITHHLDYKSNKANNLITLCESCHSKLHWRARKLRKSFVGPQ